MAQRYAIVLDSRESGLYHKPPNSIVKKLQLGLTAINGISVTFIYAIRQFLPIIFKGLARFILPPFNAVTNLVRALLFWYEAHREGYKKPGVIKALVFTVATLGVTASLIGSLVAGAAFAVIGPCISIVSFSIRALYHSACAVYYGLSFLKTKDKQDKEKAVINGLTAVSLSLNVIAIGLVLIALKASFGVMGMISGLITASCALFVLLKVKSPSTTPSDVETETSQAENTSSSNSMITRKLKRSYSCDDISLSTFNRRPAACPRDPVKNKETLQLNPSAQNMFSSKINREPMEHSRKLDSKKSLSI